LFRKRSRVTLVELLIVMLFYSSIRSLCLVNVRSDITGQPSVCVFVLALACRF